MRIVAGIQCYDEEDFIRETLSSLYDFCDIIIVTEGCWSSGIKSGNPPRSSDNTIKYINAIPDPLNKIKLFHYNGKRQVDHREFTLEKAKEYGPDWYLNGDGDEIFHEKQMHQLLSLMKGEAKTINPTHKLFWNGFDFYEKWRPRNRFFKLSGLNLNNVKASRTSCNEILYNNNLFPRQVKSEGIYIYHPSYCKNLSRQNFKIQHRTIDNKKKFLHSIKDGYMIRGNKDLKEWITSLKRQDPSKLPKYLLDHELLKHKNENFENLVAEYD